jgi:hypothetical protein
MRQPTGKEVRGSPFLRTFAGSAEIRVLKSESEWIKSVKVYSKELVAPVTNLLLTDR